MKKHVKGIGSALLSLAFVFAVFAVAGSTAQAQYRDGRYQNRDDYYRAQREREREWRRRQEANRRYENRTYNNGRYGNYGNSGNYGYNQQELNRGYQQGLNTGSNDARRGQSYSPERSHFYRDGCYSQAFRQGFVRGYDQGYRQYAGYNNGRYGNNGAWGNILGGIFRR